MSFPKMHPHVRTMRSIRIGSKNIQHIQTITQLSRTNFMGIKSDVTPSLLTAAFASESTLWSLTAKPTDWYEQQFSHSWQYTHQHYHVWLIFASYGLNYRCPNTCRHWLLIWMPHLWLLPSKFPISPPWVHVFHSWIPVNMSTPSLIPESFFWGMCFYLDAWYSMLSPSGLILKFYVECRLGQTAWWVKGAPLARSLASSDQSLANTAFSATKWRSRIQW